VVAFWVVISTAPSLTISAPDCAMTDLVASMSSVVVVMRTGPRRKWRG
jgi:hypothetical protein